MLIVAAAAGWLQNEYVKQLSKCSAYAAQSAAGSVEIKVKSMGNWLHYAVASFVVENEQVMLE